MGEASFELSAEQRALAELARQVARERVAPRAAAIDEEDRFPEDLRRLFGELELLGLGIPEAYGGGGAGLLSVCLVIEELARVSATASLIVADHELGLLPVLLGASEEQKRAWLPAIASGEKLMAFALTEPEAGSDAAGLAMRAERRGDRYVLNGTKRFITHGNVADWLTVFARTDPEQRGSRGISCFLVERETPGLTVTKLERKMGLHGSPTAELSFEDVEVPATNRIGEEGQGFRIAMATLDHSRPGIAAQALGIAQGALDEAVAYARQRRQFGRPLADFQAIQFMIADMAIGVESARYLTYKAAAVVEEADAGRAEWRLANRFSAMAKTYASDVAMRVTTDAVQIFGGYGYIADYPVERMMRDAKITQIYEGTNQIQRLVIARSYLG
ncbi:MAG: acyl-CoA dehydrogenase family protein [Clostridia bacterium]|nr:acyl-CoA dehydrogenase family protein [Clostridia bacterium]